MDEKRAVARRDVLNDAEAEQAGEFFTAHRRFIENVARQHAPTPDDVPDIVQMVGLQVCRSLGGFRGDANPKTWLYRVTVNTARDYFRSESRTRKARAALTEMPIPEPILDPDDVVLQNQRLAALQDAVDQLRPIHQHAIRNKLGGTAVLSGSNKATYYRGRRRLADILADDPRVRSLAKD